MADQVSIARRAIYDLAKPLGGKVVEDLLKSFSGVPTMVDILLITLYKLFLTTVNQNAFFECLGSNFNLSRMLVVDLLHEFELGVWKALFTHLIRILYAAGNGSDRLVVELDRR